jgi:PHD finger-like domain-containing protein 5A
MAKHHPDLIMCRKLPGIAIGRLCEKCALAHRALR